MRARCVGVLMAMLFWQLSPPAPGQDAALWLLGAVVILGAPAMGALFMVVVKSKDANAADWKVIGTTATVELSKTTDSLRTLTEAIERNGRDQSAATERTGQAVIAVGQDVRKLSETLGALDRRLERIEDIRRPTDR